MLALLSLVLVIGIHLAQAGKFDVNSTIHQNTFFKVATSSMQGMRRTMEDAHSVILPLTADAPNSAYIGVFDGHGGQRVALLASQGLHEFIFKEPEYRTNVSEAIKKGFMGFDATLTNFWGEGSTANIVVIKDDFLYCANAGDSRAVSSVGGVAEPLSVDHKPNNANEAARIQAAGGHVEFGSILGKIAVSRALGDYNFKQSPHNVKQSGELPPEKRMMIALPDVQSWKISEQWEFVIMACDGVWDVISNEDAVKFVRSRMTNQMEPEMICEELVKQCLEKKSGDNLTVIILFFLHGKTYAELCAKISQNTTGPIETASQKLRNFASDVFKGCSSR